MTADVQQRLMDAIASRDAAVAEAAKATEQLADISYRQQGVQQRIEAARLIAPMDGTVVKMAKVGINETVQTGRQSGHYFSTLLDPAIEMVAEGLDAPLLKPGAEGSDLVLRSAGYPVACLAFVDGRHSWRCHQGG